MNIKDNIRKIGKAILEIVLVSVLYLTIVSALTWPAIFHLDTVILGGGEFGGWLWRQWWHFEEVKALLVMDLGFFGFIVADRVG